MKKRRAFLQTSRRIDADHLFYQLRNDIISLHILPGTKLSETEIARQRDVSRQSVSDAFIRLSGLGLLTVRPRQGTLVRKISSRKIRKARLIRAAIEIEVVRKACGSATDADFNKLDLNLTAQATASFKNDSRTFQALDYDFHQLICNAAEAEFAFATIVKNKSQLDRLCMLMLADKGQMLDLLEDHSGIADALKRRNVSSMIDLTRQHLYRVDGMLENARVEHSDYFED